MQHFFEAPGIPRGTFITLLSFVALSIGLGLLAGSDLHGLHPMLDTGMFALSSMLAMLLWDIGRRLDKPFPKHLAITFAAVSLLEFYHAMVVIEWSGPLAVLEQLSAGARPISWPPAALLLPVGVGASLLLSQRGATSVATFAILIALSAFLLLTFFQVIGGYAPADLLGITRPQLAAVPVLWAMILYACWRMRAADRLVPPLALMAAAILLGSTAMLYSQSAHDPMSIIAHLSRVAGYLGLQLSLMHMASADMVERIRAERDLARANEELEERVAERTRELSLANAKAQAQLSRLALLHRISRAIGERQDIDSIFQVVVRSIEDELPADFVCMGLYNESSHALEIARVGVKSAPLADHLAMPERARVPIDENGLSRCIRGNLVYEPDIADSEFPFPQRLASGGLHSFVAAPLQVESQVFGALIVGRPEANAFSSGECEFLRQLSEHTALASHQARLMTALQQAYDELRQTQDAVMQQERLRALGQMASGIAHDINNALSPIALYTESLLEAEPGLSAEGRTKLEIIERAIDDAAHTVNRMKDFSRQRETELTLTPIVPETLLRQVVTFTQARWRDMPQQRGKAIDIRTEFGSNVPSILGVEPELREAFINLIFNAVDALPEGGTITLRTGLAASDEQENQKLVCIEISDNGVGMDEATRRRCLEPFFTTKGDRGTGLGLAMVYGVAQRHSADLDIDSTPGRGTTIRLTFKAAAESISHADTPRLTTPDRRLRVLLIDDDPILLRSLRQLLEGDGHVVATASDGEAGVAAFRDGMLNGRVYDVVVTDLGMPRMDGRRVAAAIKGESPSTPVIMLTGWGERLKSEEETPEHVDQVLSKPPKLREVRSALAKCTVARDQTEADDEGPSR